MILSRRHFLHQAVILGMSWPVVSLAGKLDESLPPQGAKVRYSVKLDKNPVGEHHIAFRDQEGKVHIEHQVDIVVKFAFVTAYALRHTSNEIWDGVGRTAKLLSLDSDTIEDGVEHRLQGKAGKNNFVVQTARGEVIAPMDVATTNSFWADAGVLRPHLLDSMDGSLIQSKVDTLDEKVLDGIPHEHARLHADDRSAEAWFRNDILVQGMMNRNGHTIYYHLV
jgi:hypothetical protein